MSEYNYVGFEYESVCREGFIWELSDYFVKEVHNDILADTEDKTLHVRGNSLKVVKETGEAQVYGEYFYTIDQEYPTNDSIDEYTVRGRDVLRKRTFFTNGVLSVEYSEARIIGKMGEICEKHRLNNIKEVITEYEGDYPSNGVSHNRFYRRLGKRGRAGLVNYYNRDKLPLYDRRGDRSVLLQFHIPDPTRVEFIDIEYTYDNDFNDEEVSEGKPRNWEFVRIQQLYSTEEYTFRGAPPGVSSKFFEGELDTSGILPDTAVRMRLVEVDSRGKFVGNQDVGTFEFYENEPIEGVEITYPIRDGGVPYSDKHATVRWKLHSKNNNFKQRLATLEIRKKSGQSTQTEYINVYGDIYECKVPLNVLTPPTKGYPVQYSIILRVYAEDGQRTDNTFRTFYSTAGDLEPKLSNFPRDNVFDRRHKSIKITLPGMGTTLTGSYTMKMSRRNKKDRSYEADTEKVQLHSYESNILIYRSMDDLPAYTFSNMIDDYTYFIWDIEYRASNGVTVRYPPQGFDFKFRFEAPYPSKLKLNESDGVVGLSLDPAPPSADSRTYYQRRELGTDNRWGTLDSAYDPFPHPYGTEYRAVVLFKKGYYVITDTVAFDYKVTHPEMINVNTGERRRVWDIVETTETLQKNYGTHQLVGERVPIVEFGKSEENKIDLRLEVYDLELLEDYRAFFNKSDTYLYRDAEGRYFFLVIDRIGIKEKYNPLEWEISLAGNEVSIYPTDDITRGYEEGVR